MGTCGSGAGGGGEVFGADGVCDAFGDDLVDGGEGFCVEMPAHDAEGCVELGGVFGSPEGDGDAGTVEHPADGEFGDGFAEALAGKCGEPIDGRQILRITRRLKLGVDAADVVEAHVGAEAAAEQAAAK